MKSLQEGGLQELEALRKRVMRSYGMQRINQSDCMAITTQLNNVETLLLAVEENNPKEDRREF